MPSRRAGRSFVGLEACRDVRKPCSRQTWRRTAARVSEKVGRGLRYQAAAETRRLAWRLVGTTGPNGGGQGHDGEQAEQAGRGAGDRPVRPLPLGLDAE